jgi:hypothetical protein
VDLWQILTKLQTSLEYQQSQRFFGIETMASLEEIRGDNPETTDKLEKELLVILSSSSLTFSFLGVLSIGT